MVTSTLDLAILLIKRLIYSALPTVEHFSSAHFHGSYIHHCTRATFTGSICECLPKTCMMISNIVLTINQYLVLE